MTESKTQFHQGLRLQNKIQKSPLKLKVISEKSGVPVSSVYDLYKKPELLRSKIKPILDVLEIDADTFYGFKTDESKDLLMEIERLKAEVLTLRRELELKEEIIQLLKKRK